MQLLVVPSLVLHIVLNGFFISCSSDGVDVKARGPESSTPEDLTNLRVTIKEFSCGEALDRTSDFSRRKGRNGLEKEMHMIFVCSYFYEGYFVVLSDGPADILERFLDGFCKHFLSAFNGTDQMVEKKGDIVGFPLMLAHMGILLLS